ncbi:MAG: squalene--hopene cyclase [Actinobacteria bacterium]|nr:squalene--hopene cyclase [Actinomycetota bacterium]
MAVGTQAEVHALAAEALRRAVDHLLRLQHPDGWWKGELETNVTMDAEDLLMREFLGVRGATESRTAGNWIRAQQRADGTWANFYGGPPDLSTTVEAYVALKLVGDAPDAAHMQRAAAFIREQGGLEATRVFTRIWLALFGWWPWDALPGIPPEMIFLPSWFPLNIYDFACWARQTVVALTIVRSYRPVTPAPFALDEIRRGPRPEPFDGWGTWRGRFQRLDRVLRWYERHRLGWLRELALRRAEAWIVARQEADGSWGGIQPPWVYSMIALSLRGYPLDHPVLRRAFQGWKGFTIEEGDVRRLEACQSPVWDAALAMIALSDAGLPPDHAALRRAGAWILGEEVRRRGDWAVRRPALQPGGWAFEFANVGYPDIDDTAEVLMALRRVRMPDAAACEAVFGRGLRWAVGMQSRDGGWGAFDADNTQTLCTKLPFSDFGAVIDPPSADVTAHMLEMMGLEGMAGDPAVQRGLQWLLRAQEVEGSWFGRWGANYVYGTGAAVPALVAAGVDGGHRAVRRAVAWLEQRQNPDGGWGEDLRSYDDRTWAGRGTSTASQTAWALLALHAAGERSTAVERGVRFLAGTQRPDGTWDEPWYTGTGFPGAFYINYHLYRLVFPVMALGRFVHRTARPA